jgi:hypothetical protein
MGRRLIRQCGKVFHHRAPLVSIERVIVNN